MDTVLFLFIFPIATIIFAIALQKILCNPFLVSSIILAIFLIVTFTVYGVNFLIAAFIYAAIALVTAYIVSIFCKIANRTIEINFINGGNSREGENSSSCSNNCNCAECSNSRNGENRNSTCSNVENRSGNNSNNVCDTLCNGDPNTTACRTCACQRQFRNCLRRV